MFSRAYRRYSLAIVTIVFGLINTDRGLMILLLQPIKEDLQLSDTQLGLLTGIAFGVFYATVGLPIARWADRGDRATITSAAIGLWGLTLMLYPWISSYPQMLAARIGAAVGESGGKPPTYSLVGDYFPGAAERARAMGVYWLSSPIGSLISFLLGGWLYERYGWRKAFFLIGIPGVLLAVLVKLTLKEPRADAPTIAGRTYPSLKAVLLTLWCQPSCRHLGVALILLYTMGLGMSPWYAAFMMRSHGLRAGELGVWLGLIFGLSGAVGVLLGGQVTSRWFPDNERGQMCMTAVTIVLLVPCYVAFLTLPQEYAALTALAPLIIAASFYVAPAYALMQRLVPDEMRATLMAAVMLLANLIGMGVGPQVVGMLSDALNPSLGDDALRYAMLIMSCVSFWAAYHFWQVGRTVHQDLLLVRSQKAVPS
jgi:MFS family permease